uniref:NADH dehydrogenase subunit 6 n=1 Tax=Chimarra paramonorum TaxID=2484723 RepID=UPI0022DCD937|nr:NADH dehydrogenase subunit 6 [Chimarra paramonorum]UZZ43854.1 NADH dehydrogenase subunit 6 [Chimarra paramonorum]
MIFLFTLFTITSITFMIMKTPMSLGLMILIQILASTLLMNFMMQVTWLSYIIYLVYIGGMMIMFMYVCSITPNKLFTFTPWIITLLSLSTITSLWIFILYHNNLNLSLLNSKSMTLSSFHYPNLSLTLIFKLFNNFPLMITLFTIIFLFTLMIIVNKITNFSISPMRKLN